MKTPITLNLMRNLSASIFLADKGLKEAGEAVGGGGGVLPERKRPFPKFSESFRV